MKRSIISLLFAVVLATSGWAGELAYIRAGRNGEVSVTRKYTARSVRPDYRPLLLSRRPILAADPIIGGWYFPSAFTTHPRHREVRRDRGLRVNVSVFNR